MWLQYSQFDRRWHHWAWFIRVDKDTVSVGMVTPRADFLAKKQSPEEFFKSDLYSINPELKRRIRKST